MMYLFANLECCTSVVLILLLIFSLIYETINGFHDTANAVATVIYTRALSSWISVVVSGVFNFLGVLMGGLSVAYTIVHLLPADLLLNIGAVHGLIMMFAMLLAAILWNLSTWCFGLPASSSHTLIGAIIGIGLTNALVSNSSAIQALNIPKLIEIFFSLIISPLIGFIIAGSIIFIFRFLSICRKAGKFSQIHLTPFERQKMEGKFTPPFWTRTALVLSSAGVSFSHGANDGQKGIGLIMLVLIKIAPTGFVLNINASKYDIMHTRDAVNYLQQYCIHHTNAFNRLVGLNEISALPNKNMVYDSFLPSVLFPLYSHVTERTTYCEWYYLPLVDRKLMTDLKVNTKPKIFYCCLSRSMLTINRAALLLNSVDNYRDLSADQRSCLRHLLMCIADATDQISKLQETPNLDRKYLHKLREDLLRTVEYAPTWIILVVATALSLGTIIGWRRVAATIGQQIGKRDMTYAQGLAAQITAAISIGIASYTGMPVSTTHVLSSAITGAMVVDGSGVRSKTVKKILFAWILTLPVAILLSGILYWLGLKLI